MLGRDKQFKDVKDYLSDVADATLVAVLLERGFTCSPIATTPVAPDDVLVTGTARFVGQGGRPLVGVQISVSPKRQNYTITSPSTGEVFRPSISTAPSLYYTDGDGRVTLKLFKGSTVLFRSGLSSAVREILVPDVDFDLLGAGVEVADDMYSNVEVAKDLLIKRDV